MTRLALATALLSVLGAVTCDEFSYNGSWGPDHWNEHYNTCGGKHQSPININSLAVVEHYFPPIELRRFHEAPTVGTLMNNGHTVVVDLRYADQTPSIAGGPLANYGVYRFKQFHFHWGENNTVGSEDRINDVAFPAELHVVLYNVKYETFEEALRRSDGLAVLAYFFALNDDDNPNYTEFAHLLDDVQQPDTNVTFAHPPTLAHLTHNDTQNYYTYTGSMTTPPCRENVTWIDFATPIQISAAQIAQFRQLYTHGGEPLVHNFRPVQPLNQRTVYRAVSGVSGVSRRSTGVAALLALLAWLIGRAF